MFSLKTAIIGAAAGFIVSFIAGITGRVDFLIILFRALLSAVFSALLVSGIRFLYLHFLADVQAEVSAIGGIKASPSGSVVDITLDDTELPDTDTAPDFVVGNDARIPHNLKEDDQVKQVADGQSGAETENDFVPYSLEKAAGESVFSEKNEDAGNAAFADEITESNGTEGAEVSDALENAESFSESPESYGSAHDAHAAADGSGDDTVLDTLPDLDGFTPQEQYAEEDSDILSFNDRSGGHRAGSMQPESAVDLGDAKNIAAAIRTALQKDS